MEKQGTRKRARSLDAANEDLPRPVSTPRRDDDREGHCVFNLGENLTPRYKFKFHRLQGFRDVVYYVFLIVWIKYSANWVKVSHLVLCTLPDKNKENDKKVAGIVGTFGRVLECWDRQSHELVAVKVVRSIGEYRDDAKIEIDILHRLAKHDRSGSRCVQIPNCFDYRNHICIVFEKLEPSLFDFLRGNKYCPFPVDLVREFGRQLLESVAYMHDLRLIHTDLKPENILLVSSENVKLPGKRNSQDEMKFRCLPKSSANKADWFW